MYNCKKRSGLILLVVIITIMLFGGCRSSEDQDGGRNYHTAATTETTIETQKILEGTTLTFYFPQQGKPDTRKVLDKIESQTKKSLNIKLDFKWVNGDYQSEIYRLIKSEEPIDAFCGFVRMDYQFALFEYSKLKDISKLLPQYAPNLYAQCGKEDLDSVTFNGKMVFLPIEYPVTNATYVIIREDLRKKYNLGEIKTFQEYEAYLEKIKQNDSAIMPGALSTGSKMELFLPSTDYFCLDSESKLVYRKENAGIRVSAWEQTPEFKKMIGLFTGWKTKQYILQNDLSASLWDSVHNYFAKGKIGSFVVSESDVGSPVEILVEASNRLIKASVNKDWELKAYRLYSEKKAYRVRPIDRSGFTSLAFPQKSKNTESVLSFINWVMADQKNYDLFMYGINGVHYIAGRDNTYSLPSGVDFNNDRYAGWSGSQAFRNIKFERYTALVDGYDRKGFIEKNSEYSLCAGFYADMRQFTEAMNNRINSYYVLEGDLAMGKFNSADTIKFVTDMKNAGAGKVVEEVQKQLDVWRKK